MMGRSLVKEDPTQAIDWFQKVHKWRETFHDGLSLSSKSTGWEAYAELQRGNYTRAIELYMTQYQGGEDTRLSLKFAARNLVRSGDPEALLKAAANPLAQEIVTAYIISRRYADGYEEDLVHAKQWLEALEQIKHDKIRGIDRLALTAYQAGDMTLCSRWPGTGGSRLPATQWLEAKMLLRAGKIDQAQNLLTKLAPVRRPKDSGKRSALVVGEISRSPPRRLRVG